MSYIVMTCLLLSCLMPSPAPPPTAKEIAAQLVENCHASVGEQDKVMLARSDVRRELNRLGVIRGWLDPKTLAVELDDDDALKYAVTTLRYCRSLLRKEKEKP
jgi:hypothetical protein